MNQIVFDDSISNQLESLYRTRDVLRRRQLVRDALDVHPGMRILDIGCGPGFYVAELREQLGPEGSVVGVDASPDMLRLAKRRCQGYDNVAFHQADVTSLPVEDASVDRALCVQVLEYVPDVMVALAEMYRALRVGGRLVVWDVDWATVSWHTADQARMERVLRVWDRHLTHPSLPQTLVARLRSVGFEDIRLHAHAFATTELVADAYGGALFPLVEQFIVGRDGITEDDAKAWAAEQRELGERGEFFFACIQFCFTASRDR